MTFVYCGSATSLTTLKLYSQDFTNYRLGSAKCKTFFEEAADFLYRFVENLTFSVAYTVITEGSFDLGKSFVISLLLKILS